MGVDVGPMGATGGLGLGCKGPAGGWELGSMDEGGLGSREVRPGASATGLIVARGSGGCAGTPFGVAGEVEGVSRGKIGVEEVGAGADAASSGVGVTGLESGVEGGLSGVGVADEKGEGGVAGWDVGGVVSGVASG